MAKSSSASSRAKKSTPTSAPAPPIRAKPSLPTKPETPGQPFANRVQYGLFLLTLLAPIVFSTVTFFGFTSVRVLYVEAVLTIMAIVSVWQGPVWLSRLSITQIAVLSFLGIMLIANSLGIDPQASFWSGFARMEGFVTYLYLGLYFLIISRSQFTSRQWTMALALSVSIAVLVVIVSYWNTSGWQTSDRRMLGTVGSPTFLAIYLVQQLFMIGLLILRSGRNQNQSGRWPVLAGLIGAAGLLVAGIVLTGSRSALASLGAGLFTLLLLLGIRYARSQPRTVFLGVGVMVVLLGIGWMVINTDALQGQSLIYRLTHLSGSLNTWRPRLLSSEIALNAIAERPILGWGQDNYSYGFARHYIPALVQQSTDWYDRVHNVPLEWAFSGGIIGLLAYLFIWVAVFFQLNRSGLPILQKQVITAGLMAYFVFNLFNPDSTVALQGFFLLLAFVDASPTNKSPETANPTRVFFSAGVPLWFRTVQVVTGIGLLTLAYFTVSVPTKTLSQLNQLNRQPSLPERVMLLERAYQSATVGKIDVADQLVTLALSALNDPAVSAIDKQGSYDQAITVWGEVCRQHPESSRYKVRLASLQLAHDSYTDAFHSYIDALAIEKGQRPGLFLQLGSAYLQQGNIPAALTAFKRAHQLVPQWETPVVYEAMSYVVDHQPARADSLLYQLSDTGLITNIALVKQAYYMARNPAGLMKRINKVPYKHQFTTEMYVEWSTAAFDAHDADGLLTALNTFARHYGARFDYALIKQLYDDAITRNVAPTEGMRQLVARVF